MKQFFIAILVIMVGLVIVVQQASAAEIKSVNYDFFSKNLVNAIKSDNEGLQRSAMMRIIQYSDKVAVNDAVYDIIGIFRNHQDLKVRQLALVTLHKIGNNQTISYLKRHVQFEKSPVLRKQIYAMLNEYQNKTAMIEPMFEDFAQSQ